ncbi:MAG: hypothetical protein JO168_22000 [Solirubrobacterales bacterium]|nr:hypothetical protein [Solirubrobacterales bacterium]MBV9716858.1 hypothetical protein [Solirubrobacterales bacterium]
MPSILRRLSIDPPPERVHQRAATSEGSSGGGRATRSPATTAATDHFIPRVRGLAHAAAILVAHRQISRPRLPGRPREEHFGRSGSKTHTA